MDRCASQNAMLSTLQRHTMAVLTGSSPVTYPRALAHARAYKPRAFGDAAGRVMVLSRRLKRRNEIRDGVQNQISARASQGLAGGCEAGIALARGQSLQRFER